MPFTCRIRFKTIARFDADSREAFSLALPDLPMITVQMLDEARVGSWAVASMQGFESQQEASAAGERLASFLLLQGVLYREGVDLGYNRDTLRFGESIHEIWRQDGLELRGDVHGLMVFEEGTVGLLRVSGRGVTVTPVTDLQARATDLGASAMLTETQLSCASLINDSFFVGRVEAQFILRISAIEALTVQGPRSEAVSGAVSQLCEDLSRLELDEESSSVLHQGLLSMRRQSIGEACREMLSELLTDADASSFTHLYRLRSRLLHDGVGRGELDQANVEALRLAAELLRVELVG